MDTVKLRFVQGRDKELSVEQVSKAFVRVFSTPDGQRVLKEIYRMCGMFSNNFVRGDAITTVYNEGRRAVGASIMNMIDSNEIAKYVQKPDEGEEKDANDPIDF